MWIYFFGLGILLLCTGTFIYLIHQAPMDTDIWPGGEPQLKPEREPWDTDEGIPW